MTHVNLNRGSLEGFVHADYPLVGVQFHPESSPGPHDAGDLFERSLRQIARRTAVGV